MSRLVRVKNSVRHAQAQGLARRIQQRSKAANPPPRLERKEPSSKSYKPMQYEKQSKHKLVNGTISFTKCSKSEVRSGAGRLKMLQNRSLEGCCAASGGLLGHLGVGGASGEAS